MDKSWNVANALDSYQSLCVVINQLTKEELTTALDVESATRRRSSIISRLMSRLVRLHELEIMEKLREKYEET